MTRLILTLLGLSLIAVLASTFTSPPTASAASRIVRWGYLVDYDSGSAASFRANAANLDVVSPNYFSVEPDGTVSGKDVPEISNVARAAGVRIVPMVQNKSRYADFTPTLADPAKRTATVSALCQLTTANRYDGLNIDFEYIRPEDRDSLTGFYADLATCLRANGKLVTIAVPSRVSDEAGAWSAPYDFAKLGQLSDYVVIMTYAFRTAANQTPGSISPIDQVRASVTYTVARVPAGKVLLGIGLWGYDWNTTTPGRAVYRKHPDTMALALKHKGTLGYDSVVQSAWLRYSDGASHVVWFEDRRSVQAKTNLALQYGLGGVAFWRLGHEDSAIWPYFATFNIPAGPADYAIPNGRFFTQTGGGPGLGYRVIDGGQDTAGQTIRFWSEFRRLGGIDMLGYPISRPYVGPGGFTYQAFQRAILQWRPEANQAWLANTFEQLTEAGRDGELVPLGIPAAVADDGSGGDWAAARAVRLGWLTNPEIRARFYSRKVTGWNEDAAIQLYGLPASAPVKSGPFVVQRFQRVALQLWVETVPGMPPKGSVVGILGGDLLKNSGLIPAEAAAPEQ